MKNMKTRKMIIGLAVAAGAATIGAAGVLAETNDTPPAAHAAGHGARQGEAAGDGVGRAAHGHMLESGAAGASHVRPAGTREGHVKSVLDGLIADGTLTATQADKVADALHAHRAEMLAQMGDTHAQHGKRGRHSVGPGGMQGHRGGPMPVPSTTTQGTPAQP